MKLKVCLIHDIGTVSNYNFEAVFLKMRNFFITLSILFLLFAGCGSSADPRAVKIALLTDVHYLDKQLTEEGEALTAYERSTGRNVKDLHAVLNVVLDDVMKEAPDLLLIAGDITNHGEKQSHLGFIEKIRPLQARGTRIFVVPGNHDIHIPDAKSYRGDKPVPVESISKEDFATLYASCGYAGALKRDSASLSYLAEINESTWLLCFDTNRYAEHTTSSITGGRILPETMAWALDILREAKEKGIVVLGMMHHGLVEHMPYQAAFFPRYLVDDWQKNADLLADAGLKVVFTGHFHANDITMRTASSGNAIYDVETGSLAQYPFAYRIMELHHHALSIESRFVTSVPGNPDLASRYREKLQNMTRRVAENRLKGLGIPLPQESLDALAEVIVMLNMLHVSGDEKPDASMMMAIRLLADQMDSEADAESFSFDFPPEDNNVTIPIR